MIFIDRTDVTTLRKMIAEAKVISIISHTHPDGDALGSSIAMRSFLRSCGKDAKIILPDSPGSNLQFMLSDESPSVYTDNPKRNAERILSSDLLLCLDFNSFSRVADLEIPLRESRAKKVLVDHHLSPDRASFDLVFSECGISSAAEYLFWILMEMPEVKHDAGNLPKKAAEALMTGMTTDSNNFANSVYPSTLEMASLLLAAGVDREGLLLKIFNQYKENRLRAMGWLLKDEMTITGEGLAYMVISSETAAVYNLGEGDTEGFVNLPLAVESVRMSILLKEDKNYFRVSIRSKKGTSANLCANEYFNGGGHELAAGGKLFCGKDIPTLSRADAAAYIEKISKEFLR